RLWKWVRDNVDYRVRRGARSITEGLSGTCSTSNGRFQSIGSAADFGSADSPTRFQNDGPVAYFVRMLLAAVRNWSRNHAWSASGVSRGCQAMKYEKPLMSCGGSTTRTSAGAAAIFPSLRG